MIALFAQVGQRFPQVGTVDFIGQETSKRNRGCVPDKERRFNNPLLFSSSWREAPIVAQDRQLSVGSFVATPLAVAGAVYIGSTDGAVYAVE